MSHRDGGLQNLIQPGPTSKSAPKSAHLAFPAMLCILACILSAFQPASAILTTCYDPSGDVRKDVPCYQDAANSVCCGQGWVCTNASLCIAGPTVIPQLNPGDPTQFEGSCTDRTWNSPACPSFCRQGNLTKNAANGMWNCSGGNWCCSVYSGDTTCCERNANVFFLGDFVNVTTIGGSVGPGFTTSSTISSSTSSTPANTTPASSSTSAASSTAAPSDSGGGGLGDGAKAGIGVGVTLGVILVAAFGFMIWRNRRSTNKLREQIELLSARGNEVPKDPRYEPFGNPPYHQQERYELGGLRDERAELPATAGAEDGRMRWR